MSRTTKDRLLEILNAITVVRSHLNYGGLDDLLVWDAVCMRLFQIGEVTKGLDKKVLATYPGVRHTEVIGLRNVLAHRYYELEYEMIEDTVKHDLDQLEIVIRQILADEGTTWQFRCFADLIDASY
jgi:uncharacterized protein with HEPN domain